MISFRISHTFTLLCNTDQGANLHRLYISPKTTEDKFVSCSIKSVLDPKSRRFKYLIMNGDSEKVEQFSITFDQQTSTLRTLYSCQSDLCNDLPNFMKAREHSSVDHSRELRAILIAVMEQHLNLLKQFTSTIRANTDLLHDPSLQFFREFMEEFGAAIPPKKKVETETASEANSKFSETEPMEEESPIPYPSDIDNSGVIEADHDNTSLPMGDPNKEASDEDLEKANEERDKAQEAFSQGNFDDALKHFTEAIELNPGSAILHAKRASVLLKLKRPMAAIADCDKAISINPDSAQGYKFRGRAYRPICLCMQMLALEMCLPSINSNLLGKWVEAHTDLATACKLDYDDIANEWLKEVEPNVSLLGSFSTT
ncbi:tetratricopeptide repeat protein [Dictyocaulus viviparus]|uniref:Tetratricopeptide repeat protein n=1 Tax=Dictyocaulus viviparus TaxID=29172 RepID=A0A0D8XP51_DICVI|nr:tetratricopeptide repeat protein [Dictyocaulus viviparus]